MPKIPEYPHKPLQSIYNPTDVYAPASMKQKNLIITLYERRKLPLPDIAKLKKGEAAQIISNMLN